MLKSETHNISKFVQGAAQIQKLFQKTDIDHFVLISPTSLMAYLKPSKIKYK